MRGGSAAGCKMYWISARDRKGRADGRAGRQASHLLSRVRLSDRSVAQVSERASEDLIRCGVVVISSEIRGAGQAGYPLHALTKVIG